MVLFRIWLGFVVLSWAWIAVMPEETLVVLRLFYS